MNDLRYEEKMQNNDPPIGKNKIIDQKKKGEHQEI